MVWRGGVGEGPGGPCAEAARGRCGAGRAARGAQRLKCGRLRGGARAGGLVV